MANLNRRNVDDIRDDDRYANRRDGEEFHESLAGTQTFAGARTSSNFLANILLVVGGVWLIIAPFVINYASVSQAAWNDVIVGIVVAVAALANMGARAGWLSWLNFLLGVWLIVAPFALSYKSAAPTWNDVVLGVIVCILAAWSGAASDRDTAEV
jgi:hypothetical protein